MLLDKTNLLLYINYCPCKITSLELKFNPKLSPSVLNTKSSTSDGNDLTVPSKAKNPPCDPIQNTAPLTKVAAC